MKLRGIAALLACMAARLSGQVTVAPTEPTGISALGAPTLWTVTQSDPTAAGDFTYSLLRNGITPIKHGPLKFIDGKATIDATMDQPGALFLEIHVPPPSTQTTGTRRGPPRILSGALVNPQALQPTLPPPPDFDEWWATKIQQLQKIPPNPVLEKQDAGRSGVDYFKLRLDTIDGKTIHGQIARTGKEGKRPALLLLQWAGIYPLQKAWVVERANQGWLALNIEPHDIDIDREPAYYQQLNNSPLRDYFHDGNNEREKSYFLRMYLSAYRAADYLASREDWDGKTLVVMGTSMGGQQSFATAGLNDNVTAMLVLVPSGCDSAGPTNSDPRAAGFPDWAAQAKQKNDPAILQTACYFDPVNFAAHIRCPALVSMGLYDETSPPAGVFAAFNRIPSKNKEALPLYSGHQEQRGSQRPYNLRAQKWLDALSKGTEVPPPD